MTEPHDHGHHGPDVALYFKVFGALAICTALSFVVNVAFKPPDVRGAAIIMGIAVIKASLVGYIFGPVHLTMLNGIVFFGHQADDIDQLGVEICPAATLGEGGFIDLGDEEGAQGHGRGIALLPPGEKDA